MPPDSAVHGKFRADRDFGMSASLGEFCVRHARRVLLWPFGMFRQARLAVTVLTDLLLTTKALQQLMNEDAEASPNDDRNADPQGNLRSHGHCATGHEASEKLCVSAVSRVFPFGSEQLFCWSSCNDGTAKCGIASGCPIVARCRESDAAARTWRWCQSGNGSVVDPGRRFRATNAVSTSTKMTIWHRPDEARYSRNLP